MRFRLLARLVALSCVLGALPAASASADTAGGASVAPGGATTAPGTTTTTAPAVSQTKTVTLTRSQTKSVQRRVGVKADGAIGARTRAAIARYQSRKRLTRTGKPNLQTLRAMHLSFATAIERKLAAAQTKAKAPKVGAAPEPETTDTTEPAAPAGATPSAVALQAVEAARAQIGTPYRSAGTKPGGFDCSGLTMWAFDQVGVALPRTSFDQFEAGTPVARADIVAGDLVFFATDGDGASHVGIATSATTAISSTSHGVREHEIFDDYWGAAYVGARRVA